jgi:SAM-dependent methyltransferase/glycosyltransferase involved in cell wall biosynthesis
MPYPGAFNPDLLERIPLSARVVLDIGCGTGALGAEYKRRNPAARYFGVDSDAVAARVAAQRLDQVFLAEIDGDKLPFGDAIAPGSVDCIIYGDVLEHLADPWGTLRAHVPLLAENGIVVVCMPNVEHWSFAERVLRGTFDYEAQGLFDRTHLRWFTPETTCNALRAAGLTPLDSIPRVFDAAASDAFVDALAPGLRQLGIDVPAYRERAQALQHVWRAWRRPTPRLRVVSTMLPPQGGVSHVRVIEPMQAMASDPSLDTRVIGPFETDADLEGEPGIFIYHRPLLAGQNGLVRLRKLLARNWLVVCEFDDNPDQIRALQRPDVLNFRAVHAVQTSTEPLAEMLRRDNPNVAVFPNAVARLPDVTNYGRDDRVTLLFAGLNRENEWPEHFDALNSVAAKAGERLHFTIVADRGLYARLATPHKSFVPICGYDMYQALLAQSEISFMPLADTPFNRCKSDLKFIEAAAFRVTPLASDVVYSATVQDGRTGVLFRTPEELVQRLMRLIANPDAGRAIADAARDYVIAERMLAQQTAQRVAYYHDLWARREELRRALLARVPALAE